MIGRCNSVCNSVTPRVTNIVPNPNPNPNPYLSLTLVGLDGYPSAKRREDATELGDVLALGASQ